jgi:hypothetical protein
MTWQFLLPSSSKKKLQGSFWVDVDVDVLDHIGYEQVLRGRE